MWKTKSSDNPDLLNINYGVLFCVYLQFFAFGATSVFAVDTFFHFRAWRTGQIAMRTTTMTTNSPEEPLAPATSARY